MSHTTAAGGRCVGEPTMSDESDSTIELNRRRVLSGLGVIGIASAGAGAGTMALFSDSETSSGNTVQAGTLDLNDGVSSTSFSIGTGSSGLKPGDKGTAYFPLTNNGSLNGSLDVGISNVSSTVVNSSEADDEFTQGEFTITAGSVPAGPLSGSVQPFSAVGLDGVQTTTTTLDNGSGNIEITVDTVADLSSTGIVELILNADNDGNIFRMGYSSGNSGLYYKRKTSSGWGPVTNGTPPEVNSSNTWYDGDVFKVTLNSGNADVNGSAFGLAGFVLYPGGLIEGDDGNYMTAPVAPEPVVEYGKKADHFVTIDGSERTLDDILVTSFTIDDDFATDSDVTDGDETLVAESRPSRMSGTQYDVNESLNSGETKALVLEYSLPYDAGNAVQGEEVTFDITAELNQEDSQ